MVRPDITVVTPNAYTVHGPAGITRLATVKPKIVSTVIVESMGSYVIDRPYYSAA